MWQATTFTKQRDRLLDGDTAGKFLAAVLACDKVKRLLSSAHFSADGACSRRGASPNSFCPKSLRSGDDPRDGSGKPPGPGRHGEHAVRGDAKLGWQSTPAMTTYSLARLPKLLAEPTP